MVGREVKLAKGCENRELFLTLGLSSSAWLEQVGESLVAAESRVSWAGDDFVHYDVYSGNVCFVGPRALLVDWDTAGHGNRWNDVAFALLNLRVEGARLPDVGLPQKGDYAALLCGLRRLIGPKFRADRTRRLLKRPLS